MTPEPDNLKQSYHEILATCNDPLNVASAIISKLERERDEARAELQTQLNNIAQYDHHYQLHVAELDQLRKELAEAKSGNNVQCNTAWLETLERSNCYLTTGGKIVSRNEDQLRKVADAVIAYDEFFGKPSEGSKTRHDAYDHIVNLCNSLPHVIERNSK